MSNQFPLKTVEESSKSITPIGIADAAMDWYNADKGEDTTIFMYRKN